MCHKKRQGFTLIEISVVMAILTVAVMFLTQVMLASRRLDPVSEETRVAAESARIRLEEMRALGLEELIAKHQGATFDVEGLTPPPGRAHVGEVEMPLVDGALREDLENAAWGMPRDLNRDGVIDTGDHATDALILPVTVRLEWASKTGRNGKRVLVLHSMFARL